MICDTQNSGSGLGVWLSGRVCARHVWSPGSRLQHQRVRVRMTLSNMSALDLWLHGSALACTSKWLLLKPHKQRVDLCLRHTLCPLRNSRSNCSLPCVLFCKERSFLVFQYKAMSSSIIVQPEWLQHTNKEPKGSGTDVIQLCAFGGDGKGGSKPACVPQEYFPLCLFADSLEVSALSSTVR